MQQRRTPLKFQSQPALDDRRRMDASDDGLRQISQRSWRRRPVRRLDQPGCASLWELQRHDGLWRDVQPGLSELFENVVGGAGEWFRAPAHPAVHVRTFWCEGLDLRASERLGAMDVENGAGRRLVVLCRPPVRVDPAEP